MHELAAGGDHRIAIGRVVDLRDTPAPAPPLLFAASRYHSIGAPLAPAEVPLPSRLADLRVCLREWSDDGSVAMVAMAGDPRGRPGAAIYVHRGCLVGDLLGGCCHGRDTLHAAIRRIAELGGGAVVYHRPAGAAATCAAAGGTGTSGLDAAAARTAVAAARELRLRDIRLLTAHEAHRGQLAAAGLDVAETVPL